MHGQVRELCTQYGPIDVFWFDGGWERTAEQWRSRELRAMIHALQPAALVNDRLPGEGDFDTPEQFIPAEPPARAWETCLTINESWAHNRDDHDFKSGRNLVHALCEVAGKDGNLLLNVGPMGDGRLAPEILERLAVVEAWMARHADGIVGTEPGLAPWQFYGPSTRRGDRTFLHLLMRPYDAVTVRGVPVRRVRGVRALAGGAELPWTSRVAVPDRLFNPDPLGELRIVVPEAAIDPSATVIAVEFAPPARCARRSRRARRRHSAAHASGELQHVRQTFAPTSTCQQPVSGRPRLIGPGVPARTSTGRTFVTSSGSGERTPIEVRLPTWWKCTRRDARV
jgi:alpha-L-fucosidase